MPEPLEQMLRQRLKTHVVIVGGGIGGVHVAKILAKYKNLFRVTLINASDYYIFKPRLYEWLNGQVCCLPMEEVFLPTNPVVEFIHATVTYVSRPPDAKSVTTDQGVAIPYDFLILAPGATTAYFDVKNAEKNTLALDTYHDIMAIRDSVIRKLERASAFKHDTTQLLECLSFEIIGGGPTGIELAFDLKHYVERMIQKHYNELRGVSPMVQILEGSENILPGFSDRERRYVQEHLKMAGIQVLTNHQVREVCEDALIVAKQDCISGDITELKIPTVDPIWVAGVQARLPEKLMPGIDRFPRNERVKVTPYLELLENPGEIYVIGDTAGTIDLDTGKLLPPIAQVANQEAEFVARDILWKLGLRQYKRKPFEFVPRGRMLSLGPGQAMIYSEWPPLQGVMLTGRLASILRQTYYSYLIQSLKEDRMSLKQGKLTWFYTHFDFTLPSQRYAES